MDSLPIRLLLADDDADDRVLFADALNELSLSAELSTVKDGEELMQQLTTNHLPDLLFLDLNMPRKNGFECLSEIKRAGKLREIPVVIFSTSFDPDIVEILFRKGARHYVRKPNGFEQLKKVIIAAVQSLQEKKIVANRFEDFVIQS